MKDLKAKDPRIAIFYADDEFGKESYRGFEKAMKAYGLKIAGAESYRRGSIDYASQAVNLKRTNPDYVYLSGVFPPIVGILKECQKIGFKPQFIQDLGAVSPKLIEIVGDAAEGLLAIHDRANDEDDVPAMRLIKKLSKEYGIPVVTDFAFMFGWANTMILVEGLQRAGQELTVEGLVEALETFRKYDVGGATAPVTYRPGYRKGISGSRVLKVDLARKKYIPVTDWREPSVQ